MNLLMEKIAQSHDFTEYELKLIRFYITGFLYDISKILLLGIFFGCTGKFVEFLFALIPLMLLRKLTGGFHCKTYMSCLAMSFVYLFLAIIMLPALLAPALPWKLLLLLICTWIIYYIGPISSNREIRVSDEQLQKIRTQSLLLVLTVSILLFLFPDSICLIVSFWTVVLHSLQLILTKIKKRGVKNVRKTG